MNQEYIKARVAQLKLFLPQLKSEYERLKAVRESSLTGRALGDRGLAILKRQADECAMSIAELER